MIQLRIVRWEDCPGLSGWAYYNHKHPYKCKGEGGKPVSESERKIQDRCRGCMMQLLAGGHESRSAVSSDEEDKKKDDLLEPLEGMQP